MLRFLLTDGLNLSRISCLYTQLISLLDSTTILSGLSLDAIYSAIHIHTIHNTLFKGIIDNTIIVEESHSLWNRSSSKTNHLGRGKVVKNLLPIAIDASVTFINDDHIKEILWQCRILWKFYWSINVSIIVFIIDICYILTFQQREKTLYCRDNDITITWNLSRFKTVDSIDGIERISILCKAEHAELSFCLLAQVIAVNQEEDSSHRCIGKETI